MSAALQSLQLMPERHRSIPGLVAVNGSATLDRIDEQYAMRQVAAMGGIDYVFFRRFSDGRSSHLAACVIDNHDEHFSESQLAEIHRRLWLNGGTPLLYIGWQTRVDLLSCARGPDFWKNSSVRYEPAETIEIATQVSRALEARRRRFSAYRLSDGTFWDNPDNSSLADAGKAAHRRLISAVVETDKELEGHRYPVLRRLLLLTVLIKYLEDRGVFPDGWFDQCHRGAESFFGLLQRGSPDAVRELLGKLERRFNGDVFELPKGGQQNLTTNELRRFSELVEARTLKAQRYLWDQFSFRHIPVEVLSHLYQHFAQRDKGAVFTPPMLANLILDYSLPYEHLKGGERVLDPTCGSGVFLVGAFRRLVQSWQSRNGWKQPDVAMLKSMLKQSIFGVELQEDAVHLTAFSLALAVCDALQPNVIWKEVKFDKLVGSNLLVGDFFDQLGKLREIGNEEGFSAIIGNPPFVSKLSEAAQRSREKEKQAVPVPDNQMAYFIAEQSMSLLKDGGRLCLIQPHGLLYNEKPRAFQKAFISANQLEAVLDFTSVRKLYDGADPKTVALLVTKRKPAATHHIHHLTFRRTFSVQERIGFELDHYDRHLVPQSTAEEYPWVWRVNLLGGGRLQNLAARMDAMPKLKEFIEGKKWDYGEGFIAATGGKRESAPWLTGQPFLPTEAFTKDGIDQSRIGVVTATRFRSAYTNIRYTGPIVMIREHDSLPCVFRPRGFLAYKAKIVGIHSDITEQSHLEHFHKMFIANQNALRAFCLLFGTQALMGKSTAILKRDIDVLPWPENGKGWNLSRWEQILCQDLVDFTSEFVRLGQNSRLLRTQVSAVNLKYYAETFVGMLGSVYSNLQLANSGVLDGLAFQAFCFGTKSELDWPQDWSKPLRELIYVTHGDALRTIRVLRFYDRNTIVIVKPNRLRYWIGSTAIRDADETLVDLRKQGY